MIDIKQEVKNEVYQEPLFEEEMAYNSLELCGTTETKVSDIMAD